MTNTTKSPNSEQATHLQMQLSQAEKKRVRHHVMMLWIMTIFLGLVPAIFILLKGGFHGYVKANAKQALNLFLSICLYMLCFVALSRFLFKYSEGVGVSLLGGVYVINMLYIFLCGYGLVKGSKFEQFRLPFTLRLFR